jgi:hypothetical protein
MKVEPSGVEGVELIGPDAAEFGGAIEALVGRKPDEVLKPALRYSVIARNHDLRAVALLGVRFDMVGRNAKAYSVVHYANTLRHPEQADLTPGSIRFVCAEPLYTDLVLRRGREVDRRALMNLENLRRMLRMRASIDCAAFTDGEFAGPDSLGAFDRLACEREAERALVEDILRSERPVEDVLRDAMEEGASRDYAVLARRTLARRLYAGFEAGGKNEAIERARNHRLRLKLWRREHA